MEKHRISIIVPCYNEGETLNLLYKELHLIANKMEDQQFEFIFVNDGSRDQTLDIIKQLREKDNRIHYISFSRNFGKEAAIYAGLRAAQGDYVTLMDADLQDPPHLLETMYNLIIDEGYDCVATHRVSREGEPRIRSYFAKQFYKIMNKISDSNMVDGARDYRMMNRKMINAILQLSEYNRFSKGLFGWVGFKTKWLPFEYVERVAGETKWSFWKLFTYAVDGITAFSTVPLMMTSVIGLLFFLVAILGAILIMARTLLFGDPVAGWPSLVTILLFVSGIQLFCLGILGQYLAKTYTETKRRPVYIIDEIANGNGHNVHIQ